jgi:serine/threonine protein kinase
VQVYTRDYCSPEVAQAVLDGRTTFIVQPATDMWGVGVIMYQLVTGVQQLKSIEWQGRQSVGVHNQNAQ